MPCLLGFDNTGNKNKDDVYDKKRNEGGIYRGDNPDSFWSHLQRTLEGESVVPTIRYTVGKWIQMIGPKGEIDFTDSTTLGDADEHTEVQGMIICDGHDYMQRDGLPGTSPKSFQCKGFNW